MIAPIKPPTTAILPWTLKRPFAPLLLGATVAIGFTEPVVAAWAGLEDVAKVASTPVVAGDPAVEASVPPTEDDTGEEGSDDDED